MIIVNSMIITLDASSVLRVRDQLGKAEASAKGDKQGCSTEEVGTFACHLCFLKWGTAVEACEFDFCADAR